MSEPNATSIVGTAGKAAFDLAQTGVDAVGTVVKHGVGAAGDVGDAVLGEVSGVEHLGMNFASLTVTQATDLVNKLLGRIRTIAGV